MPVRKSLIPINMRDGSVWRWEKAIQNSSSSQNRISINSSGMSPKSGEIESRLMLRTSAIFFKISGLGIRAFVSYWVISCAEGFVQTDGAAKLITGHSSEFSAYLNPFSNSYVEIFSFFWYKYVMIFRDYYFLTTALLLEANAGWSVSWFWEISGADGICSSTFSEWRWISCCFRSFFHSSRAVACSASNFSICASSFSGFGRAFTPSSFRASLLVMWSSYSFWCCPR